MLVRFPEFRHIALANRVFAGRVVRYLARNGVRQFIDIGSGVVSSENTHQIVDAVVPDSRVVYVVNEPVAVAHAELLLDEDGDPFRHAIVSTDLRCPDQLWHEVMASTVIDPGQPVAVLMFSVLHMVRPESRDDDLAAQVARYRERMPVGSCLAVAHVTDDGIPPGIAPKLRELRRLVNERCRSEVSCRSRPEIDALLGDFEPIEPGMVWTPQWSPAGVDGHAAPDFPFPSPNYAAVWAGVGRKTRG